MARTHTSRWDGDRMPDILARISIQDDGCFLWIGTKTGKGYGRVQIRGRRIAIHRLMYEHFRGPIPAGLCLDHLCRNRACCNPDHLEPVSLGENILRGECEGAVNARKTHCIAGHPLDGSNLRLDHRGSRQCVECSRRRWRETYYRARERNGEAR